MVLLGCDDVVVVHTAGRCRPSATDGFYVVNGTDRPRQVVLEEGERRAIGTVGLCTATVIRPRWVVTATHCGVTAEDEFCTSTGFGGVRDCVDIVRVIAHPDVDVTLVELAEDARVALGVVPLAELDVPLDDGWLCRTAEAAGLGMDGENRVGRLQFTAEPIVELSPEYVVVDGSGRRGLCRGDSGGPLMVTERGSTRLIGTLHFGDRSCRGRDSFVRLDQILPWLVETAEARAEAGSTAPACDASTDDAGRCATPLMVARCSTDDTVELEACIGEERCGWDPGSKRFDCVTPELDPCRGLDALGTCDVSVARRCVDGELRERRCAVTGEICTFDRTEGARCVRASD